MKNKNIIYVVGALVIVGGIIMYNRYQKRKKSEMNAGTIEEETSGFIQQVGTTSCSSPNESLCKQNCENMGGQYNTQGDRKCYKNGMAISGGVFGGIGKATNKMFR